MTVGKKPLLFPFYVALSRWLLDDSSDEASFAHCFLTITWNLMCRSKNTVLIHQKHISWQDDCLTVIFGHTKIDTTGETSASRDRHDYANPLLPEICCVTSLARYLVSFPSSWESPLFPGSDQYDRFRKILKRVVHKHNQDIRRLGVDPAEIGVHSIGFFVWKRDLIRGSKDDGRVPAAYQRQPPEPAARVRHFAHHPTG